MADEFAVLGLIAGIALLTVVAVFIF